MPGANQNRDIVNLQVQLITTILKLARLDVPIVSVWYHENNVQVHGTKHLKDFIDKLDQEALKTAIKEDVFNFGSLEPNEPLLAVSEENIPERIKARQIFQQFYKEKEPEKLPFPLSCMNKKEKITWITKQILQEQREKSGNIHSTVKYGDANLMPSFWLNDEWDWLLLNKNLSNVTTQIYTGPGQFQDFLTRLVDKCLSLKGKDSETFISDDVNKVALKRRMKSKGIHEESHIVEEELTEEVTIEEDTEAPSLEYRLPASTTFVPRRKLPDDTLPRFPGSGPAAPAATPVAGSPPPPCSPPLPTSESSSNMADIGNESIHLEPTLTEGDFQYCWSSRQILSPPAFLQNILQPLHPGWKSLDNDGKGACLYKVGADHIWLKDFKILRKFTHSHIIQNWYFYSPFYTFPFTVKIGSGNDSYRKNIYNAEVFLQFLKTEESMFSFNSSQAELIALGNVMKVNINLLTYNLQGREGPPEDRAQWNLFQFNPALANENVFCRSVNEPLRILHEDEVHYTKLVWMPAPGSLETDASPETDAREALEQRVQEALRLMQALGQMPAPGSLETDPSPETDTSPETNPSPETDTSPETDPSPETDTSPICSQGSLTRKRSREVLEQRVNVQFVDNCSNVIVDKLKNRKRKKQ